MAKIAYKDYVAGLTPATSLTGVETKPIVQGGSTKSVTQTLEDESSNGFLEGIRQLGSSVKGYTLAPGTPSATLTLVDGRCQVVAAFLYKSGVVTGIKFLQLTQGNYTADNNNRLGLYTVSEGVLTLVASSANDGNLWKATAGWVTTPFSTPYTGVRSVYYVGYIYNSSAQTTAPQISGITQLSANAQFLDLTNSNVLSGYKTTSDLVASTTPMSDFTPGVNAIAGYFLLY